MSTAASSTKPNGTSPVTDVFVLSPEKFQIEVHEIGLSKIILLVLLLNGTEKKKVFYIKINLFL